MQHELFENYSYLVDKVYFNHFSYYRFHKEDLIQEGYLHLWKACANFTSELEHTFKTYAYTTVKGGMQKYIRDKLHILRLPRSLYEKRSKFFELHYKGFSEEEIALELNLSLEDVSEILTCSFVNSLDFAYGKDIEDDGKQVQTVEDLYVDNSIPIDVLFEIKHFKDNLSIYLADTHPHAKDIFLLFLEGDLSQQQIGKLYGLSQMGVSRILKRITNRLQIVLDKNYTFHEVFY